MPRRIVPLLALLLTAATASFAADPTPEKVFGWLSLRGDSVPTRYTPGSLDRAANVQWRLEIVMKALDRAGVKIDGINLYLASPEDWEAAHCTRAYGLPESFASTLILPAWGTDRTVALWTALVGRAPGGDGMMPIRGTPEEAASLVWSDVLGQVEAARIGLHRANVRGSAPWVTDVLAHLVALDAFVREEPQRLAELDSLYAALRRSADPAIAAEARAFAMAREISGAKPGKLANRMVDWWRKYGGTIPAGELLSKIDGARPAYDRAFAGTEPR